MGCVISSYKKTSAFPAEPTTYDYFEDEDRSFNPEAFKTALHCSIATGAQVSIQNVVVISLVRLQNESSLIVQYTISKDNAVGNAITLISLMSTYISCGAMSLCLQNNGYPNVSANAPQCFMKFSDLTIRKTRTVLKVIQKISSVVDPESLCNLLKSSRTGYEKVAWEMQAEVATIIEERKMKKTDAKLTLSIAAAEKLNLDENPDNEISSAHDSRTKIDGPQNAILVDTEKESDRVRSRMRDYKGALSPGSRPAICVGASTISGICTNAIRKNLKAVTGADLGSVCIVSASPWEGKAAGLTIVYTVNIQLCNVTALIKIIQEAVAHGYTKASMLSRGWPLALASAKVLDSTSFVLMQATQKFSGLSLPSGCSYMDFSDPGIFLNTPPCPNKLVERKPVFRLNVHGDFECMVSRVGGRDRSRTSENIPYRGLSDSFKISGQSSPSGSEGGKGRGRRVTFESISIEDREREGEGDTDCLHVQPEEVDRVRRSEYLAKYDEIVGTRKDTVKRRTESKRDPTLCSDMDSESPTHTSASTATSTCPGSDVCSQSKTCSRTPPPDMEVSEVPVQEMEPAIITPSPTPPSFPLPLSLSVPLHLPSSPLVSTSSRTASASIGSDVTCVSVSSDTQIA